MNRRFAELFTGLALAGLCNTDEAAATSCDLKDWPRDAIETQISFTTNGTSIQDASLPALKRFSNVAQPLRKGCGKALKVHLSMYGDQGVMRNRCLELSFALNADILTCVHAPMPPDTASLVVTEQTDPDVIPNSKTTRVIVGPGVKGKSGKKQQQKPQQKRRPGLRPYIGTIGTI